MAALLHDIGDDLAPYTHGEMVAAILAPFVAGGNRLGHGRVAGRA